MTIDLRPGSPDWLSRVTSSKAPAILGASPHSTPAETWATMRGDIPFKESDNDAIFRGNHVEAYAVAYFWERRHPEWTKHADGHTWTRDDAPWAACNTDSHGADDDGLAIVEAKSVGEWADLKQWGEEGTDQVPLDYWWQTFFHVAHRHPPHLCGAGRPRPGRSRLLHRRVRPEGGGGDGREVGGVPCVACG